MNENTIQHLNDLRKAGFDVSGLIQQMQSSPLLDKQGDSIMGGGILRQAAFTRITQQKAEEVGKLEAQIAQLSAMKNAGAAEDSPLYKAALEVINEQQELLIKAGFDEEQVKDISIKAVAKAEKEKPVVQTQQPPATPVVEKKEDDMAIDTSNLLDLDTYKKQTEDQIFGNASLSAIIQNKLNRAQRLGIEIPDDKINNLGINLRTAIVAGKTIDQFLDEDLGIAAKQKEVDDAARAKEISDARAAGRAEGLKESGTPRRVVSRTDKHPIYDNIQHRQEEKKPVVENENKEIPRNKWGDQEIYRTRGDKFSRIQAAEEYHEKVLERSGAENSIPSE